MSSCYLESDVAVAAITTPVDRARERSQPPAVTTAHAPRCAGTQAALHNSVQMRVESFASGGSRTVAAQLYEMAGVTASDMDVALLYDHFSPLVLMQLEDYGFCGRGEGGDFVSDGNIRWPSGSIPINT